MATTAKFNEEIVNTEVPTDSSARPTPAREPLRRGYSGVAFSQPERDRRPVDDIDIVDAGKEPLVFNGVDRRQRRLPSAAFAAGAGLCHRPR